MGPQSIIYQVDELCVKIFSLFCISPHPYSILPWTFLTYTIFIYVKEPEQGIGCFAGA